MKATVTVSRSENLELLLNKLLENIFYQGFETHKARFSLGWSTRNSYSPHGLGYNTSKLQPIVHHAFVRQENNTGFRDAFPVGEAQGLEPRTEALSQGDGRPLAQSDSDSDSIY